MDTVPPGPGAVRVTPVDAAGPLAADVLRAYQVEISAMFGFDPTTAVSADPDELTPPRGAFLVAFGADGEPLGCGGVKLVGPRLAEVKRMWVSPSARGRGVGSAVLAALEDAARDLGAVRGVLDTHGSLEPALRLYERNGWQPIEPYNDNPYATHWFGKALA